MLLSAMPEVVFATTLVWDGDVVTTGLQDGGGNWDTSSIDRWWAGSSYQFWNNANNDSVIFGVTNGAAGQINLLNAITVESITFNPPGTGSYTIKQSDSGKTLTLAGTPVITANADANISATMMGNAFTKEGPGVLTLGGTISYPNTYFGPTTVNNGTLVLGKSASVISIPGDLIVNSNATVRLGNRNEIADSATITINGGVVDLASYAEIAGTVILNGGSIVATSGFLSNTVAHPFDFRSGLVTAKLSGPAGLVKSSPDTLVLSGTNNYAGETVINNGVLNLSGGGALLNTTAIDLAAGAILTVTNRADGKLTLNSGQTLQGAGAVAGDVAVSSGAFLAPGSSVGTLTINGVLMLAAGSSTTFELDQNSSTSDSILGLSSVVYGGTLLITNIGGSQNGGETYQLFAAGNYSGAFDSIVLPALPSGLVWTNRLAENGSIAVAGTNSLPASPSLGPVTRSGGDVVIFFSGPVGQDFRLWAGTDVAVVPLANSWSVVTNDVFTGETQSYIATPTPDFPQRFYLLTSP